MEYLIRYLHLSDFHVGKDDYAQRKIFKAILDHVREKQADGWVPDLVFITGDIANRGQASEYDIFNYEFLAELETIFGNDWQGKIFAVPGNHDVDRSRVKFLDREAMGTQDAMVFDVTPESQSTRQTFVLSGVQAYIENDESHAAENWLDTPTGTFTEIVDIHGVSLGIVGINTAWLSKDDKDKGNLTPGLNLVQDALEGLPDCDLRIVLGHHPLDWFLEKEANRIRQIFGKHHVLYLHGHLHRARARGQENSAGKPFLSIQAGAAFQARDDEVWRNGLLWGELDLEQQKLRLQPRHWSMDHDGWVMSSDAFSPEREAQDGKWWEFALPGTSQAGQQHSTSASKAQVLKVTLPEGWNHENLSTLASRRAALAKNALSEQEAVQYFDGGTPDWRIALSPVIPRRAIVQELQDTIAGGRSQNKPTVALLLGAGGEGKSTAVFQTIVDLVNGDPSWQIIWRYDPEAGLSADDILALPEGDYQWLITSDDADLIAEDVFQVARALQRDGRQDVQFLLTCRDTDWIAAEQEAKKKSDWSTVTHFHKKSISGLTLEDSTLVVQAWQQYGEKGLGQLSDKSLTEAAQLLVESAEKEATTGEGAFFGAMLKMRIGDQLKEHLRKMLNRFAHRKIPGGGNLQQAFGYIAAMHSEGLMFLSKPVLVEVLGLPEGRALKPKVLVPLGKEAAATQARNFIFTRHKSIAEATIEILTEQEDIDELYVDLAKAAIVARLKDDFVPDLHCWFYEATKHFNDSARPDLAIQIGKAFLERDPSNHQLLVNLANIYRIAGEPDQAILLFREKINEIQDNRGFFVEWGTAESSVKNQAFAVLLQAISLTDQASKTKPNNNNARIALANLGVNFRALYDAYNDPTFIKGQGAIAYIGLTITKPKSDPRAYSYLQGHLKDSRADGVSEMDWQTAFQSLLTAITAAYDLCVEKDDFPELPSPDEMTFEGLRYLIENAAKRSL